MELFLLRHGQAHPNAPQDSERELTAAGREEVKSVCAEACEALQSVSHVLVSPYVRAQQTCELAMAYLPAVARGQCTTAEYLTPCANPDELLEYLYQSSSSSILCVTHQPLVGTLLDDLCGFEPGQYRMCTAALANIRFSDVVARGLGELQWLKTP